MSDVLHHAHYTPTQSDIMARARLFRDKLRVNAYRPPVNIAPPKPNTDEFGPVVHPLSLLDYAFGPVVIDDYEPRTSVTCRQIIKATALYYGLSRFEILSHRRQAELSRARHIAMYLCRTMTGFSLPHIGRELGDRDHTTVLHGTRKMKALVDCGDRSVLDAIDAIKAKFQD